MKAAPRRLKASWLKTHFALHEPFLPANTRLSLHIDEQCLLSHGGQALAADMPGCASYPLSSGRRAIGALRLLPDNGDNPQIEAWAKAFVHGVQSQIDSEESRHAISQEALNSYREMALLQRTIGALHHSLKPASVAAALLAELNARMDEHGFGAVFLREEEDSQALSLLAVSGEDAQARFLAIASCAKFKALDEAGITGDIVSDLQADGGWDTANNGFRSLLWMPLMAHGDWLGLLILASAELEAFAAGDLKRAQALAGIAAAALGNARLFTAHQRMFHGFVKVIAAAIDAKSSHTADHCRRVPEIALLLADAANATREGPLAGFNMDEDGRNALMVAAMLHDCGKLVTPEWIIGKVTRLEGVFDRIDLVALRFEILRRDAELNYREKLATGADPQQIGLELNKRLERLDEELAFLRAVNVGKRSMSAADNARVAAIAIWSGVTPQAPCALCCMTMKWITCSHRRLSRAPCARSQKLPLIITNARMVAAIRAISRASRSP